MKKDVQKLLKQAVAQGFTIKTGRRNCHIRVLKNGRCVAVVGGSPSSNRTLKYLRADLRRAGFIG